MAFTKKIPEWNASGVEPPQSLKDSGWKPGVKPAADHFNWLQTTASEAIKELQQKAGEVKKVNGQLPDANGNVNVNIDTSKLATKEELSSASTYIQQEMNDLEQTVGAHQTDLASQENGKGASLIGIEDSANQFTATTVEGALTELFTSVSNGKSTVANAITQKGQTASGSDTFAQLAAAVSNIKVGKLKKEGTATSANSTKSFITGQGASSNNYYISVDTSLFGFEPNLIYIVKTDKSYGSPIVWQKENFVDNSSYKANYSMGTIFRVPFVSGILDLPVNASNSQYNWYAYE